MEKPGDFSVTYRCTNPKCGDEQTLLFFSNENHLPVTCCTKCRAGFGVAMQQQLEAKVGMFPTKKTVVEEVPVEVKGKTIAELLGA